MSLPSDQRARKGCGVCAARDEFSHRGSGGGVSSTTELHRSQPQAQLSALPSCAVEQQVHVPGDSRSEYFFSKEFDGRPLPLSSMRGEIAKP